MVNPFLGEVALLATFYAPDGWIACQGQLLSTAEFDALFSLLGTTFGGDGSSTFAVPTFSSLTPAGGEYCMAAWGQYPLSARASRPALIGEVALFPYNPPPNWINCDGQLLQIAENESLFSLLGTQFGGDGKTTFGVPDLRHLSPTLPSNAPEHAGAQGTEVVLPETIYSICSNGWSADGLISEIKLFPSAQPPNEWWLPCDGRLLPLQQNAAMYTLIGTRYGGDGRTTIGLPDFSKESPPGLEYFICTMGLYPARP